jgi:cardiolipin-specific phospholipase
MDPRGGVTSIDNLKAAGNHRVRMYIVPRAGHHGQLVYCILSLLELTWSWSTVYLDNARAVNKLLVRELNE